MYGSGFPLEPGEKVLEVRHLAELPGRALGPFVLFARIALGRRLRRIFRAGAHVDPQPHGPAEVVAERGLELGPRGRREQLCVFRTESEVHRRVGVPADGAIRGELPGYPAEGEA